MAVLDGDSEVDTDGKMNDEELNEHLQRCIKATENDLTALMDRSLVQFDNTTQRYRLHDLMRPVARAAFDYVPNHPLGPGSKDRLEGAARRHAEYYAVSLIAAPVFLRSLGGRVSLKSPATPVGSSSESQSKSNADEGTGDISPASEKSLQPSSSGNAINASGLDYFRNMALDMHNFPVALEWLLAQSKAGNLFASQMRDLVGFAMLNFISRILDFAEANESTLEGETQRQWQEMKVSPQLGNLCEVIARLYIQMGKWAEAWKFAERARPALLRHKPVEASLMDQLIKRCKQELGYPI
jgi:hypothetical protein